MVLQRVILTLFLFFAGLDRSRFFALRTLPTLFTVMLSMNGESIWEDSFYTDVVRHLRTVGVFCHRVLRYG